MKSIPEVEKARLIMNEARNWSVLRWLSDKRKVRLAADAANAALHAQHEQFKTQWPPQLRQAYEALATNGKTEAFGLGTVRLAKALLRSDAHANAAHEQAEATFAEAEKKLSTYLARQGCAEALRSWDLLEKANAKAAAVTK